MEIYWVVIGLLAILVVVDMRRAFMDYHRDQRSGKLALHGILLVMLGVILVNSMFSALGSEYELPNGLPIIARRWGHGVNSHNRWARLRNAMRVSRLTHRNKTAEPAG